MQSKILVKKKTLIVLTFKIFKMKDQNIIANAARGIAFDNQRIFAGQVVGEDKYLETPFEIKLHEKGVQLAALLNEINSVLRDNGKFNFLALHDFGDIAKYDHTSDRDNIKIEVNPLGIYGIANYKK